MGEGASVHITKGVVNRKVDALLNQKNAAGQFHKRAAFLAAVKGAANAQAYLAILRNQAGVTQAESNYMRDTWYEEGPQGLWPWLQPVYPIFVRGLIKMIEEAGETLPVDTYWVPAGDRVEVLIARSAVQVTRLHLTPGTDAPVTPRSRLTPVYIVQRGSAQETMGRETLDGVVEGVDGNVITWRVKEL